MSSRQRWDRQSGFVISLELILILTVLVIGTLVGVIAVRNALFELRENKLASTVIVKDSSDPVFYFKPVSYDLCEAPQILCRDPGYTLPAPTLGPAEGLFALVAIRPDRFATRDRIYYTTTDCTGAAYIAAPGDSSLPIGYLNALQVDANGDAVSYGVGQDDATTPAGVLYRSTTMDAAALTTIASVWTSLDPDCLLFTGADPVIYSSPMPLCQDLTVTASTFDAGARAIPLREAVEVVDSMGRNLLQGAEIVDAMGMVVYSDYTLPFNVMAWVPSVTYTPGVPEGAPLQDATAPGATTAPGPPATFPDAGPEDDPPSP